MDDNQNGTPEAEAPVNVETSAAETESEKPSNEANTETEGENAEAEAKDAKAEGDENDNQDEDESDRGQRKRVPGSQRLKRELERLRAENESLRSRPVEDDGAAIKRAVVAEIGEPPKEADFNGDYLAYERELTAYRSAEILAQRDVKRQLESQKSLQTQAQQEAFEDHLERVGEARKAIPDYDAVLKSAGQIETRDHVERLIVESDKSHLLLYHLAKNPGKVAQLNGMSEVAAARELGRIEARLSLPKPNAATKAPAPARPVSGAAAVSSQEASLDAWINKTYGKRN